MNPLIFDIENLECAYQSGNPVLAIPRLKVPKGKFVFVIGKSGIGKSTFIETLGLMNDTIDSNSKTKVQFHAGEGVQIDLTRIWDQKDDYISRFRKEHFSFIFQSTNLMPNFSCGENMLFSLLIKGVTYQEAKHQILEMMKRVSLDASIYDKKITQVSGGQRQRLAFLRAITTDYTVLLGDEPTGNLDEGMSLELMDMLSEMVSEQQRTCIIVSHDLKLSIQYADIIIPITERITEKSFTGRYGYIDPDSIAVRKNGVWKTTSQVPLNDMNAYLTNFLAVDHNQDSTNI